MKRLKLFISIFCLAISLPLAYVIWQTYTGLAQEERGQLSFFSEALFDEMEAELAALVQREEDRAVDEYQHILTVKDGKPVLSPLASKAPNNYILGYLQNNPDGSFQTPMVADVKQVPAHQRERIDQLASFNKAFNRKKYDIPVRAPAPAPLALKDTKEKREKKSKSGFADRYFSRTPKKKTKDYLGRKAQRTEEITADQALNISRTTQSMPDSETSAQIASPALAESQDKDSPAKAAVGASKAIPTAQEALSTPNRFQAEVAPLQSVTISNTHFFIFRRIAINNKIYRQGFVLNLRPFLRHLAAAHFESQPMAEFSRLSLRAATSGRQEEDFSSGPPVTSARFSARRTFPAPFNFMSVSIQTDAIPSSPARAAINAALLVLGLFMLLGLFGIYQSVRAVVALSERRTQFVSSVTHELKTPLTNIRMYIEMLEQGIAATPDREQDYFKILGSESSRLSRLINNVLELAKLEKKQRRFDLQTGDFEEVLLEVRAVMAHKLDQEGFNLNIRTHHLPAFAFDREVMIQVLINLLENSIKFGRNADLREISIDARSTGDSVRIDVADTGPGIPKKALKRVFDDFYRVDNDLTRTTGGTGIGLALVKKFINAVGGTVRASNNAGPGSTITMNLPISKHDQQP